MTMLLLFKETQGFSVLNAQKIKVSNEDKRNLGSKDRVRWKKNSTLIKRNSCSNVREELGRRILK